MDKKTHCPKCGVFRTTDNCSVISDYKGNQKWFYLCKNCNAERSRIKKYMEMNLEELTRIYTAIIERKEMMDNILQKRNITI